MPILEFRDERNRYEWVGSFEDRLLAKNAGFRWDGLNKVWYTYEESNAYKLREYMVNKEPEEIDLSDPDISASYATESDFFPPVPEGLSYRNYQRAGIDYMQNRYSALLADAMGSGKTVQVAGVLNQLHETDNTGRILIVAPASLTINWKRELEKWLVWKPTIHVFDGSKSKKYDISIFKPDISIFSYERLCTTYKKFYVFNKDKESDRLFARIDPTVSREYEVVVLDEAHYCKGESSKRTFVALSFAAGASRRYFLSGTPILNRPIEAWPLLHCLRPDIWGNRDKYATYFCDRKLKTIYYKTRYGDVKSKQVWDESGACNIEELNHMLRKHIMIRREKSAILKELPPKMIQTISLPVHCEDVAKEFDIWNRLVAKYGEEEALSRLLGNNLGIGDMGEMANIRQRVALAKVPHVVNFVKDVIENTDGQKVIVMAHHRAVVDALMEGLVDYHPVKVVGGMTAENKQMSVDLFQKDVDTKVFIGNIRAAGVGLTLTASSTVVFAELDFTPGMMEQAEDRCFMKGTRILTPQGYRRIEDLKKGDHVFGGDGLIHRVNDSWSHITEKPIVRITMWGNPDIYCTNDHRFLLTDGTWKEAGNLKKGDKLSYINYQNNIDYSGPLCVPLEFKVSKTFKNCFGIEQKNGRLKSMPEIEISDEFLFVVGYYLGDGFSSDNPNKAGFVSFSGNTTTKVAALNSCREWAETHGMNTGTYTRGNSVEVRCFSLEYARLFKSMFGHGAKNKHFAEWMYMLSKRQLEIVLQGLIKSDGYIRGKHNFSYVTTSDNLASDVAWLLGSCGYKPGYYYARSAKTHCVTATLTHDYLYRVRNNTVRSVEVVSTTQNEVYDITVDNAHTFVAENCVVHNCHRMGQTNTVNVYRLILDGSLDGYLLEMLKNKKEVFTKLMR